MTLSATVEFAEGGVPGQVEVGKPFTFYVRLSNHGNEVFQPGQVKLGTMSPQDNRFWGDTRAQIPSPIGPGEGLTFPVTTFVPQQVGTFPLSLRAVWEGRAWFGTGTPARSIVVSAPTPSPAPPSPPPSVPLVPSPPPPLSPTQPTGEAPPTGREKFAQWPSKKRADAFDLQGVMILNTDAFDARLPHRVLRWKNETSDRIKIVAAKIWLGVSGGGKCDAHGQLEREDGSLVAVLQADHYVDGPAGAAVEHQHWNGGYLALEPGESLIFTYFAAGFTPNCQAHFTVSIWGQSG